MTELWEGLFTSFFLVLDITDENNSMVLSYDREAVFVMGKALALEYDWA